MDRSDGSFCLVGAVCWYAENTKIAVRKSTFWLEFNKTCKLKRIQRKKANGRMRKDNGKMTGNIKAFSLPLFCLS